MAKPTDKPEKAARKESSIVASKNRVFDALVNVLDGMINEKAQIAFLHSLGIDNEKDHAVLLRRANEDDAEAPEEEPVEVPEEPVEVPEEPTGTVA